MSRAGQGPWRVTVVVILLLLAGMVSSTSAVATVHDRDLRQVKAVVYPEFAEASAVAEEEEDPLVLNTIFDISTSGCEESVTAETIDGASDLAACDAPTDPVRVSVRAADGTSSSSTELGESVDSLPFRVVQPGLYIIDAVGADGDLTYAIACANPGGSSSFSLINRLTDIEIADGATIRCNIYDIGGTPEATTDLTVTVTECAADAVTKMIESSADVSSCDAVTGFHDITVTLPDGTFAGTQTAGLSPTSVEFVAVPAGEVTLLAHSSIFETTYAIACVSGAETSFAVGNSLTFLLAEESTSCQVISLSNVPTEFLPAT